MAKAQAKRLTQDKRSEATRLRLMDATLHCLESYGHSDTTVSRIIAEAGVSRGALLHHYPTKNDLILDSARTLLERVFKQLRALLGPDASPQQPFELVERIWHEFFASGTHAVYIELLVASRRDENLGTLLRALAPTLEEYLRASFERRFVPIPSAVATPHEMFLFTRWLLRGMAIDAPLLTDDELKHYLLLWSQLLAGQIAQPAPV